MTIQDKEKFVQEFRSILDMNNYDYDEMNARLAEIIKNVRKSYPAGRDDY